jgi:hypothetical protein
MAEYLYKATTLAGQTVEGAMEERTRKRSSRAFINWVIFPFELLLLREGSASVSLPFSPSVGVKHLLTFTQELSASFRTPLDRSLNILEQ